MTPASSSPWIPAPIATMFLVVRVWDAIADFGALHTRLVPGFVIDSELVDDVRVITFFNRSVARERLVGIDDELRRLA